ncbi:hypothetical protein Ddc_21610 [Ditylenchus destructor]|nr:hypothetical protein Ddc_21610 [Ditylenchus destructor]
MFVLLAILSLINLTTEQCIKLNTSEYTVAGFKIIGGIWHAFVDDHHYTTDLLDVSLRRGILMATPEKRYARVFLARPSYVYFFYLQPSDPQAHSHLNELSYIFYSDPDHKNRSPIWRSGRIPNSSYALFQNDDISYPDADMMTQHLFMRTDNWNRFHYFARGSPYREEAQDYGCWPLREMEKESETRTRLYENCCKGKHGCLTDIGADKYYSRINGKDQIDFMIHCNGFVNRPLNTSELTVDSWKDGNSFRSTVCFDIGFQPSFAVEIYRKSWALPDETGRYVKGCKSVLPDELTTSKNARNVMSVMYNNEAEMVSYASLLLYSALLAALFG